MHDVMMSIIDVHPVAYVWAVELVPVILGVVLVILGVVLVVLVVVLEVVVAAHIVPLVRHIVFRFDQSTNVSDFEEQKGGGRLTSVFGRPVWEFCP
jgi:hypothetical protein